MKLSGLLNWLLFAVVTCSSILTAQTTVSGTITDANTQEPLLGVNISVKGSTTGTTTEFDGTYSLSVDDRPPITLIFSYLGYQTEEITINEENTTFDLALQEAAMLGEEVVMSASRLRQQILKSPVSIEKLSLQSIQQAAAADYYDGLVNLKGVQVTNSGINLTSVNTRGFATPFNSRFVQLADGMDTADPTINANLGSINGPAELDMESIELIPGAASALYGPNAFNGLMMMNSKSPFDYPGLSVMIKQGITSSNAGGTFGMGVYGLRYAKVINDKFAFKVNLHYLTAEDWTANDYTTDRNNPDSPTDLSGTPDFDGLNLHGDETPIPINAFGIGTIRRTGIQERTLLNHNDAITRKADLAIHYRFHDDLELIGMYRYAGGDALGQDYTKFAYRDFSTEFYKLELKGSDFFVRSYITLTNIDKTYDVGVLGALVNERFNPTVTAEGTGWANDYVTAFLGGIPNVAPNDPVAARTYADRFMIDPVTGEYVPSFQDVVNEIRTQDYQQDPPGSSFFSKSNIWHSEFYYNISQLDWAEVIVGGNFRQFSLFSKGTIFDDAPEAGSEPERIFTNIYGGYTQISKTIDEKFNLTASIRYDKMVDFDGQFTPRISLVYSPNANNNFRVNYQTGFRFPDMLQQFIFFPAPGGINVGGVPTVGSRYGIYNGGLWTKSSYEDFVGQGGALDPTTGEILTNPGNVTLETEDVSYLEPEQLKSFEIGYNTIISGKLLIDANFYHTWYSNFLGQIRAYSKVATERRGQQINAGTFWAPNANSPSELTSYGIGIGLTYNLPNDFVLTANYNYTTFSGEQPEEFLTQFNTPKNRYVLGIGNPRLTQRLGFQVNYRYQDSFFWESAYGSATIPAYGLLDAQINYRIPAFKTIVKLGGTNIGGNDYRTNFGSTFIGQVYYVSLVFDQLTK
jgi:outer membrane receptor protein involved in Fe transport